MTTPTPTVVLPPQPYDYKTIQDIKEGEIRVLIFSPGKVGKTAFALTFPDVALLDYDGEGVKCANSPWFRQNHAAKRETFRFKTFEEKLNDYGLPVTNPESFWEGIKWINAVIKDPSRKTIVIDSLTTMSRAAALAGMYVAGKGGQSARSKTWSKKDLDHMLLMTQADFGAEMGAIEQLLDQLTRIRGKNVLVLAHEREDKTESGLITSRGPLITGDRLRAKIAHWFDDVWYMEADATGKRILRCQPYGILRGVGSRLGMPAMIEDPSYDKIIKHLKGAT